MYNNPYSRVNAVNYAITYALTPNPNYKYFPLIGDNGGDCTNFISQCLRAGGASMVYNASHPWWYNHNGNSSTKNDTWSIPWAVAHSLYWTIKVNYEKKLSGPKGLEVNDINKLQIGDLIFYEDAAGKIFHSAIITAMPNGYPLISQHSFEALNIPYEKTWRPNKVHFLQITI
ncbi:amidase domain-containing protein [Clostridium lundense]|uniref:amidase domain-containing protein n=1 Tax=Clostridium lundense TaxID=319475 RepID=UPI0004881DED|nr:amidase domain-containing protein [Clostridium lundense]